MIKLTQVGTQLVFWVNADNITNFQSNMDGTTLIFTQGTSFGPVNVTETADAVATAANAVAR